MSSTQLWLILGWSITRLFVSNRNNKSDMEAEKLIEPGWNLGQLLCWLVYFGATTQFSINMPLLCELTWPSNDQIQI